MKVAQGDEREKRGRLIGCAHSGFFPVCFLTSTPCFFLHTCLIRFHRKRNVYCTYMEYVGVIAKSCIMVGLVNPGIGSSQIVLEPSAAITE